MAKSELYQAIPAFMVRGETLSQVGGVDVPEDIFEEPHIPELLVGCPGDMEACYALDISVPTVLFAISHYHGRSFELLIDGQNLGAWQDEFGISYSAFNTKGNNYWDIKIDPDEAAPKGLRTNGLQDTEALVRVLKASRLLRSLGIETENVTRVMVPHEIPYGEDILTQQDLKKRLLQKYIEESEVVDPRVGDYLNNTIFVTTLRALQISERLMDLKLASSKKQTRYVLQEAFDFVNFTERLKADENPDYIPRFFKVKSEKDIREYFTDYLPKKIGKYLGIIHRVGLKHGYPTAHNISMVGSIYDLDSVRGEALDMSGEVEITGEEKIHDLVLAMDAVSQPIEAILKKKILDPEKEKESTLLSLSLNNLIDAYFQENQENFNILDLMPVVILQFEAAKFLEEKVTIVEKYLPELERVLGFGYRFEITDEEMGKSFESYISQQVDDLMKQEDYPDEFVRKLIYSPEAVASFALFIVREDIEKNFNIDLPEDLSRYVKEIMSWSESRKLTQRAYAELVGKGGKLYSHMLGIMHTKYNELKRRRAEKVPAVSEDQPSEAAVVI
jgi:hypothetical protein